MLSIQNITSCKLLITKDPTASCPSSSFLSGKRGIFECQNEKKFIQDIENQLDKEQVEGTLRWLPPDYPY